MSLGVLPILRPVDSSVAASHGRLAHWLTPTTALVAQALLGGYIHWAVVGDTKIELNLFVGETETE